MRHSRLFLAASPLLLLTACGSNAATDLQTLLDNPLYAEQYYDAQAESMVNLILSSGALLRDPAVKEAIDEARINGVERAKEATSRQMQGKLGVLVSDTSEIYGEVLLLDGKLYTGPEFQIRPGADIRVYLSATVDPRDVEFPDDSAVEISTLQSAFGASVYNVPLSGDDLEPMRTVAFYDEELKRLVGFGQLSERN